MKSAFQLAAAEEAEAEIMDDDDSAEAKLAQSNKAQWALLISTGPTPGQDQVPAQVVPQIADEAADVDAGTGVAVPESVTERLATVVGSATEVLSKLRKRRGKKDFMEKMQWFYKSVYAIAEAKFRFKEHTEAAATLRCLFDLGLSGSAEMVRNPRVRTMPAMAAVAGATDPLPSATTKGKTPAAWVRSGSTPVWIYKKNTHQYFWKMHTYKYTDFGDFAFVSERKYDQWRMRCFYLYVHTLALVGDPDDELLKLNESVAEEWPATTRSRATASAPMSARGEAATSKPYSEKAAALAKVTAAAAPIVDFSRVLDAAQQQQAWVALVKHCALAAVSQLSDFPPPFVLLVILSLQKPDAILR